MVAVVVAVVAVVGVVGVVVINILWLLLLSASASAELLRQWQSSGCGRSRSRRS